MFKRIRFSIAILLIKLVILIIDKKTVEGISLIIALDGWQQYLNEDEEIIEDKG